MPDSTLIETLRSHANMLDAPPAPGDSLGSDSQQPELVPREKLIGFFQAFRPDGDGLGGYFHQLAEQPNPPFDESTGRSLDTRLLSLYRAAGDNLRPGGGRDVYFVVRRPKPLEPQLAQSLAEEWLDGLLQISRKLKLDQAEQILEPRPRVRVLEGLPPKAPKAPEDQTDLFRLLKNDLAKQISETAIKDGPSDDLAAAFYFIACDYMLRDFLMWPLIASERQWHDLGDPLEPYFELWRHGVKWRVFQSDQVDIYLPRLTPDADSPAHDAV